MFIRITLYDGSKGYVRVDSIMAVRARHKDEWKDYPNVKTIIVFTELGYFLAIAETPEEIMNNLQPGLVR